jgi:antitoxin (DNA-binding transcriptional repressor) of toxin-antitoxin stability system
MKRVKESEAATDFDEWLDLAEQGEAVFVERDGRVVARIEASPAAPSPPDTGERAG